MHWPGTDRARILARLLWNLRSAPRLSWKIGPSKVRSRPRLQGVADDLTEVLRTLEPMGVPTAR